MNHTSTLLTGAALSLMAASTALAVESFENLTAGALKSAEIQFGKLTATDGHVEIKAGKGRSGQQALHLMGGGKHSFILTLSKPTDIASKLAFWAERWTRQNPFQFQVLAKVGDSWVAVYSGNKEVSTGGYNKEVKISLPKGVTALRFNTTSPSPGGVLIDDLDIRPEVPMIVSAAHTIQPVIPTLVRLENNPVVGLVVEAKGSLKARTITGIDVDTHGTTNLQDVKAIRIIPTGTSTRLSNQASFGQTQAASASLTFTGEHQLVDGNNHFWVSFELKDGADIDGFTDAGITAFTLDNGTKFTLDTPSPEGGQRIGVAVARSGDGNSKTFRIPGLATTNKGTLIGVYDMRYNHGHDLPGDIDVGMSRSTDGGQTWEPLKIIMDMGNDKKWHYDGIGDPSVLVDRETNRIWVASTWSHGNRSWRGSGKGMSPEQTGQFILVYSDDDGVTWSAPVNITEQIKKPEWHFILEGPGKGITLKDGTLVFPAQFQDGSPQRMPFSTLIYSKDRGKTWHCGTGVKSNTTEAQLVELADGSIMINCRDNRGGFRTIATTKDLGTTWQLHPTDRKALNEPTCMAGLMRLEHKTLGNVLIFSNPNTPLPGKRRGRYDMTLKLSNDEGMSWPEKWHTLYDVRPCAGYSCLSAVDDDRIGVLYEGPKHIYFLRFSLTELMK